LPLAALGLTGALMHAVQVRTREIAIRMALGADPVTVRRTIILMALAPVGTGIVVGIALGIAASRLLATQLFDVRPADPLTITAVALGLLSLGWLAAIVPLRHAGRVDPSVALRDA
jgi:putative ABC transport system permease protein